MGLYTYKNINKYYMKKLVDLVNENFNQVNESVDYGKFITIKTKKQGDDPTLVIVQSKDKKHEQKFETYKGYGGWELIKNPYCKSITYTLGQMKELLMQVMYDEWYGKV